LLALPFAASLVPSIPVAVARLERPASSMPTAPVPSVVAANTVNAAAAQTAASEQSSIRVSTLIVSLWTVGAIVFLLPMTAGLWQLRRIRRLAVAWPRGQAVVRKLADQAGINREIDVILHGEVSGPMTCRILHPVIVCPPDIQSWSDAELERG